MAPIAYFNTYGSSRAFQLDLLIDLALALHCSCIRDIDTHYTIQRNKHVHAFLHVAYRLLQFTKQQSSVFHVSMCRMILDCKLIISYIEPRGLHLCAFIYAYYRGNMNSGYQREVVHLQPVPFEKSDAQAAEELVLRMKKVSSYNQRSVQHILSANAASIINTELHVASHGDL